MFTANVFDYLFHFAPLIGFAVLLAKGKYASCFQKPFASFSTRGRVAAVAILWSLINTSLWIFPYFFENPRTEIQQMMFWHFLNNILFMVIVPLLPVLLSLWLAPRNRRAPNNA